MWLVRNGVAEETAENLSNVERVARCIVFLRFEGTEWDWSRMRPTERK